MLDKMLTRESEATGITSLKIASNNVFGYYLLCDLILLLLKKPFSQVHIIRVEGGWGQWQGLSRAIKEGVAQLAERLSVDSSLDGDLLLEVCLPLVSVDVNVQLGGLRIGVLIIMVVKLFLHSHELILH